MLTQIKRTARWTVSRTKIRTELSWWARTIFESLRDHVPKLLVNSDFHNVTHSYPMNIFAKNIHNLLLDSFSVSWSLFTVPHEYVLPYMKCHASVHHKLNADTVSQSWTIGSIAIPHPHLATLTDATTPTRLGLPGADVSGALGTRRNDATTALQLNETFNYFGSHLLDWV